jgi:hypothetical protein
MTCADITPKQRWRFFRRIRTAHVRGQTPAKSHVSTCSEHVLFETQTPCRSCRWYRIGRAGNAAKRRRRLACSCLLARSPPRFCRFFLCRPLVSSDDYASPTSRRPSLLFDKLPKESPSGVYAPPLVTLDFDFSAIRKEGVWPLPRRETPALTDIQAAIAVASASHCAEESWHGGLTIAWLRCWRSCLPLACLHDRHQYRLPNTINRPRYPRRLRRML